MKKAWSVTEAQLNLQEIVELACSGKPQRISGQQGKVIVLAFSEFIKLRQDTTSLLEALSKALKGELPIYRDRTPVKPTILE
jgi:hypothetical protein